MECKFLRYLPLGETACIVVRCERGWRRSSPRSTPTTTCTSTRRRCWRGTTPTVIMLLPACFQSVPATPSSHRRTRRTTVHTCRPQQGLGFVMHVCRLAHLPSVVVCRQEHQRAACKAGVHLGGHESGRPGVPAQAVCTCSHPCDTLTMRASLQQQLCSLCAIVACIQSCVSEVELVAASPAGHAGRVFGGPDAGQLQGQ